MTLAGKQQETLVCGRTAAEWRHEINSILFKQRKYRDLDYSAKCLAEELGLSGCSLSKVLSKVFGRNYADLVNSQRVEDAKIHLRDRRKSEYSVDDIGLLVGFRNRQSFFTAFKTYVGITPQKYRAGKTL